MGIIASRPATPVTAAASGSVPLYDVPVIPTFPVDHAATASTDRSAVVKPFARPFSQSMTAFGASCSGASPTVGHPCDSPVPGASEWTTAKPRGTQVATCDVEMFGRTGLNSIDGCDARGGGGAPTSCFTSHRNWRFPDVPARYGRRLVHDRHSQSLGLGLARPRDIDEDAIALAVAVRIELRLNPERLPNPLGCILERRHDLRLAILEHGTGRLSRGLRRRLRRYQHGQDDRGAPDEQRTSADGGLNARCDHRA